MKHVCPITKVLEELEAIPGNVRSTTHLRFSYRKAGANWITQWWRMRNALKMLEAALNRHAGVIWSARNDWNHVFHGNGVVTTDGKAIEFDIAGERDALVAFWKDYHVNQLVPKKVDH